MKENNNLYKILDNKLQSVILDQKKREEVWADIGETVIFGTLYELIKNINSEKERNIFVSYINDENFEKVEEFIEKNNLDYLSILNEKFEEAFSKVI